MILMTFSQDYNLIITFSQDYNLIIRFISLISFDIINIIYLYYKDFHEIMKNLFFQQFFQ